MKMFFKFTFLAFIIIYTQSTFAMDKSTQNQQHAGQSGTIAAQQSSTQAPTTATIPTQTPNTAAASANSAAAPQLVLNILDRDFMNSSNALNYCFEFIDKTDKTNPKNKLALKIAKKFRKILIRRFARFFKSSEVSLKKCLEQSNYDQIQKLLNFTIAGINFARLYKNKNHPEMNAILENEDIENEADPKLQKFAEAIFAKDTDTISALLKEGMTPAQLNQFELSPFLFSVLMGDIEVIRLLVAHDSTIYNRPNTFGIVPLLLATDESTAKYLKRIGANVQGNNPTKPAIVTAVANAYRFGPEVVESLLAYDADIHCKYQEKTLIELATRIEDWTSHQKIPKTCIISQLLEKTLKEADEKGKQNATAVSIDLKAKDKGLKTDASVASAPAIAQKSKKALKKNKQANTSTTVIISAVPPVQPTISILKQATSSNTATTSSVTNTQSSNSTASQTPTQTKKTQKATAKQLRKHTRLHLAQEYAEKKAQAEAHKKLEDSQKDTKGASENNQPKPIALNNNPQTVEMVKKAAKTMMYYHAHIKGTYTDEAGKTICLPNYRMNPHRISNGQLHAQSAALHGIEQWWHEHFYEQKEKYLWDLKQLIENGYPENLDTSNVVSCPSCRHLNVLNTPVVARRLREGLKKITQTTTNTDSKSKK